jgi:hypothetical protein
VTLKTSAAVLLAIALAGPAAARAADDPLLNNAYQDHIAYMTTLAMPILIEKCEVINPGYLAKAAPLYFRYVNARQDAIERGRLLTFAEFDPDTTPKSYREKVLGSRLGVLETGTQEQKTKRCDGALQVLAGAKLPGEWPWRAAKATP